MAVKSPAFRKKFPLLVTGSLLALQPLASPSVFAAEQYDCKAGAAGWSCAPKSTTSALPPRPVHTESAVSSTTGMAVAGKRASESGETKASPATEQVADSDGKGLTSRSADYSHLDWVPRDKLNAAQLAEIGPYCEGSYIEPQRPGMEDDTPLDESPMFVSSKATRFEQEKQVATLAGDVVLRQSGMQAEANEAHLYQTENRGELVGNVRLRDKGMLIVGDRAELQLDNGEAKIENAEYVIHKGHVRGSAAYVKRQEDAIVRLKDGTYTRCEPGNNAWQLKGNNIKLNPATGFGTATNVTLRIKDVPVFYTPYIYFPIDDRRQSGFLAPSIGSGSDTGLALQTPYYFNLAPNYDATLYPTYMSNRGLLLEGEGRYLTRSSEGSVGAAYLDDQEDERKLQSEYEDQRWLYSWQHKGGLDSRLLTEVDYTDISDPYYFQDLSTDLGIDTPTYVNQRGTLTWRGDSYTARLNAQAYEMATVTDITPYDRLPQLTLNGKLPFETGPFDLGYAAEFVRFDRNLRNGVFTDENGNTKDSNGNDLLWLDSRIEGLDRANGDRAHIEPSVSMPMDWSWGYIKPTLKLLSTQYDLSLDQQGKADMLADNEVFDSSQNRQLELYRLDSGLYFDRNSSFFGNGYRQTLEPRAMYLYVPHEKQDEIPVFDSAESSFSYSSLWRENRFSGKDRIGDENRLSLGATSRWIEPNGFERQQVSFGQALYFADRKVQMRGIDYRERDDARTSTSPYALDYLYRFNRDWRTSLNLAQERSLGQTRSGSLMFHYQPENNPNKVVNFGYRYRNDAVVYNSTEGKWQQGGDYTDPVTGEVIKDYYKIDQHDASVIWPMVPQWNAIARWQYDYNRSRTLEAFGGFEYDSCCWKLRLINRYWVDYDEYSLSPNLNEEADRGIFLQIVLKGLGGVVGNKVETFLDQGIQGYREREDQAF
ncbi:LPS biosynthesis protein [Pseudomonas sp. HAR-UPW-AIA-41]|uniref:LPS-assembly protein LptD n=1 Tax=Pseudomonas sp. HAR-UPW-AIA-41 TaxID=1985301 RepID=UPI000BB3B865|nr:LPS-assembly protein LptD [Pseudomonas sp. HAR-UPW-AIA-41]PAV48586.1 LPS biosynthesis protein [Pseudomonas sp. HAR-UPW-AIA-41]